ncbi:MAG TPA: SCP2 sterol-binding domain-containing protein [Burkholderiaceae bacterium]|nr:SCP2 sterol-binding domain-containing protein [Burkholderiaceae bacterium]
MLDAPSASTAEASMFNPAAWVARALNHLVRSETWAQAALRPHAGKTVRLNVSPLTLAFVVRPDGQLDATSGDAAFDVSLDVPLAALPNLAAASITGDMQTAALRYTRVSGDAEFAQVISRLAQSLRWDAEEDASRFIGDAAAHRVFSTIAQARAQLRDTAARATQGLRDFWVVEQPTLVARPEMESMAGEVRRLREDLDRLDKRVARLVARSNAGR